jgi:hypothetical protein
MGYYRAPVVGYCTNFGYAYCTAHGVEAPGALGEKCGKPHVVERVVRGDDGWDGTACDWPGCKALFPPRTKCTEYVDTSLHSNL